MSDVLAIFGILIVVGIAFPGLLSAWWLLFPSTVERARLRLERTPWSCFFAGGVMLAAAAIPIVLLLALPFAPAKLAGWTAILFTLTIASLGGAGLAAKMGERLARRSDGRLSPAGAFVRGAVALELAAIFPVIGWLVIVPLASVVALGATAFAVLGWAPRAHAVPLPAAEGNKVS
jgi:hypothetical protein